MKRTKYIITILALTMILCGCKKAQKDPIEPEPSTTIAVTMPPTVTTEPTQAPTPTPEPTPEPTPTAEPTPQIVEMPYQIEFKDYEGDDNVKVQYPVITSWALEDKMQEWNDFFYKRAQLIGSSYYDGDSYEELFEITEQTPEILSMRVNCYEDVEGAAHPSAGGEGMIIDMTTGEQLYLRDLADVNEVAERLLSGEGYTLEGGCDDATMNDFWEYNFGDAPDQETLAEELSKFDGPRDENDDSWFHGTVFIEEGKVHLVVGVYHAVGDYKYIQLD